MLGKYRVLEPLGRGGMARVYRAYHPQLDRYVAVKVLRPDLAEDEAFVAGPWRDRFRREAQAVAGLRHPNIVRVYDFDVQDEIYYMVMELLEGDSLKARLNDYRLRDERMPLGESVRIILDVLDGLAYAHSQGMIHRDIKPANIMLTQQGEAVIGDFGIARIVGGTRHTVSGALMGTVHYMAPEQGMAGRCDARSDLYSLGVVFYEMLTGYTPFDGDTPLAVLLRHLNEPLPPLREANGAIPEALERIVAGALAKRPDDRPQTAEEMAGAIQSVVEVRGISVPERIPLPPPSAAVPASPTIPEPVSVLSGSARAEIRDDRFARDATDPALDLAVEAASRPSGERSGTGHPSRRLEVWRVILSTVGLLVICNGSALMASGVTGQTEMWSKAWPIELLLVGIGVCAVMNATASIWLLIPAGMLIGNGLLFSYYAITGNWGRWGLLWPMEPMLAVGVVAFTLRLASMGERARRLSRVLGWLLGLLALSMGAVVFAATVIVR